MAICTGLETSGKVSKRLGGGGIVQEVFPQNTCISTQTLLFIQPIFLT